MIYKETAVTLSDIKHQFVTYRLVRILHDLKVINDQELIRHEEVIWDTLTMAVEDVDWYHYRVRVCGGEVHQF